MQPQDEVRAGDRKKKYWLLHGKYYDFSNYVDQHPGGKDWILLGRGRDCTELFESVHALNDTKPRSMLSKFEVKETPAAADSEGFDSAAAGAAGDESDTTAEDAFSWDSNGFYGTLVSRVKKYFDVNNMSYKAPASYFVKVFVQLALYLACLFYGLVTGSYLFIILAGIIGEQAHFCLMHDGSHGAISKNPTINAIGNNITYWWYFDPWIWLRHHVYGHHCYTGIYRKDPDLTNSKAFCRKHHEASWKPIFQWQHLYVWFWMMIFPNQHNGQVLVYSQAAAKRKIFGVPMEQQPKRKLKVFMTLLSFFTHVIFPLFFNTFAKVLLMNFLYWGAIGISYFVVILPNHDTDDVMHSIVAPTKDKKIDWGEMQVRNSGNHSLSDSFMHKAVTKLYGGMNYQIEHHLFPSMNHEHYSSIAPIVQQTCKEFNIPYNAKSNWFTACVGYYQMLKAMGQKNVKTQ